MIDFRKILGNFQDILRKCGSFQENWKKILGDILEYFKEIVTTFRRNYRDEFENYYSIKFYEIILNNFILLAGSAVQQIPPIAKFNFDILVLRKDPYCILLLSVMPIDTAQKKMMKFGWSGAEIWEFYSRRYFRQDITLVELSLKGN